MTPDAIDSATASSSGWYTLPPRLMLATAGLIAFAVTQSTPAITCEYAPLPSQPRTRTDTIVTPLAMPYVFPPMVPATCVA